MRHFIANIFFRLAEWADEIAWRIDRPVMAEFEHHDCGDMPFLPPDMPYGVNPMLEELRQLGILTKAPPSDEPRGGVLDY